MVSQRNHMWPLFGKGSDLKFSILSFWYSKLDFEGKNVLAPMVILDFLYILPNSMKGQQCQVKFFKFFQHHGHFHHVKSISWSNLVRWPNKEEQESMKNKVDFILTWLSSCLFKCKAWSGKWLSIISCAASACELSERMVSWILSIRYLVRC